MAAPAFLTFEEAEKIRKSPAPKFLTLEQADSLRPGTTTQPGGWTTNRRETVKETTARENWSRQPSGGSVESQNPQVRAKETVRRFLSPTPMPTMAERESRGLVENLGIDTRNVLGNAAKSVATMISDTVIDPVGTVGELAKLAVGAWNAGSGGLLKIPGQEDAEQAFRDTFSLPSAEQLYTNPFGPAMAVGAVGGVAEAVKPHAPPMVTPERGPIKNTAQLQKEAVPVPTMDERLASAGEDLRNPKSLVISPTSERPYNMMRTSIQVPDDIAKIPGRDKVITQELLDTKGTLTEEGIARARGRQDLVLGEKKDLIAEGKRQGQAGSPVSVYDDMDAMRKGVVTREGLAAIDKAEAQFIDMAYGIEAREAFESSGVRPYGEIPIEKLDTIKSVIEQRNESAYGVGTNPDIGHKAQMRIGSAARKEIERLQPVKASNAEYGVLKESIDILAKGINDIKNSRVYGAVPTENISIVWEVLKTVPKAILSRLFAGKDIIHLLGRPDIRSRVAVRLYELQNPGKTTTRPLVRPETPTSAEAYSRAQIKEFGDRVTKALQMRETGTSEGPEHRTFEQPSGYTGEPPISGPGTGLPPEGLAAKGAGEPGVKRALVRAEEGVNRETGVTLSDAEFERLMMGEEREFPPEEGPPGVPPEGLAAKGAGEPGVGAALEKGQVGSAQRGTGLQTGPSTEPALERHMGDTPRGRLNVPDAGVPPPAPEPPPAIVRKAYKVGNESYSPGDVLSGNDATLKQGLAFKVLDRDKVAGDYPKGGLVVEHKSTGGIFHLTDRQVKQLNKFTESEAGGTPPAPFGRKAPGGRTRPNDWGKPKVEVEKAFSEKGADGWDLLVDGEWGNRFSLKRDAIAAKKEVVAENTSPITVREYPPGPPIPREKALELQGKYRDYVKREYLPKIEESNINPGVVKAFKEENGQVVWDDAAAAKGVAEAGTGIETPNAEGKFMRGAAAKTAPHAAEVLRENLKDLKLDERWDGATTVEEAFNKGQNTKYLTPEVTSQRIDLRYGPNKKGYHGNKKMAYPSEAYPKGKDTFDLPGCGREAWAVKNGLIEAKGPCYSGGKCYAEVLTRTYQGNSASVSKGIFKRNISKDVRPTLADSIKKYGIEKTRELYPEIEIKEGPDPKNPGKTKITFGTYKTASGDIVKATDASKFEARPSTVSTNLSPADGIDVRLGVDTDGGAWLSDKRVMDALLKSNPRSLAVYTSAYHTPPSPHPLAGRTTINVTVSGSHPMVETMSRLRWAEEARKNGWTVVLREVVANPKQFGDMAAQYNRLHDALLKTDFTMMQQPLHIGKKHSEPMWGMPSCCVGSKKNPQTCDRCEVAEGKGSFFKAFWGIKEGNSPRGQILPDLYQKPPLVRKEK